MGCLHCPASFSNYSSRWENLREFILHFREEWCESCWFYSVNFLQAKGWENYNKSKQFISWCLNYNIHAYLHYGFLVVCDFLIILFSLKFLSLLVISWLHHDFFWQTFCCCKVHKHAYARTKQGGGKVFVRRMLIALFNVCTICFHIKSAVQII